MNNSILGNLKPESHVYRIFSIERLFQLFKTNKNVLVHPSKWDDPFENCILSGQIEIASGNKGSFGFKDDVYGQCWTSRRESDAMWRIYSPGKNGVRVRTTVEKLINGLRQTEPTFADVACFIGKVKYLHQKQFNDLNIDVTDASGKGIADTLLYKRMEFNHEKEVRLIYSQPNSPMKHSKLFSYDFNPCAIIDQITFDPRINAEMYNVFRNALIDTYLFSAKVINKSTLYDPPKTFITKLNT